MNARTCSVDGCDRPHHARGFCSLHWQRARRTGLPLLATLSREDRFWAKVDKSGPVPTYRPDLGPCWLWTASKHAAGYGQFRDKNNRAHRVAYELVIGPIPEGLHLDHLCRVRACVNPAHLEPVTPDENTRRGAQARITHCPQGHPYDEENTYIRPDRGYRECRRCMRTRNRAWKAKRRAA